MSWQSGRRELAGGSQSRRVGRRRLSSREANFNINQRRLVEQPREARKWAPAQEAARNNNEQRALFAFIAH